jgi:hypothetical protein
MWCGTEKDAILLTWCTCHSVLGRNLWKCGLSKRPYRKELYKGRKFIFGQIARQVCKPSMITLKLLWGC